MKKVKGIVLLGAVILIGCILSFPRQITSTYIPMSDNGRSLVIAADYAAMLTLLGAQPLEATLTDIADGTIAE